MTSTHSLESTMLRSSATYYINKCYTLLEAKKSCFYSLNPNSILDCQVQTQFPISCLFISNCDMPLYEYEIHFTLPKGK